MDRFKPLRSSPPLKSHKVYIEPSEASSADPLAVELRELSDGDVELLDTVVQRAGPSATTFLTVFKAYSEVLTERGLDPHEVVYYSKLLKLGTMKGRNWGEKWARVKSEWQEQAKEPDRPATAKPVRYEADTMTDLSTFSDRTISPTPPVVIAGAVRKEPVVKRAARLPQIPAQITAAVDDKAPRRALHHASSNPSHRKRAVPPVPKPKEEQARDVIARAKGRKAAVLNDADAWKNIQRQHDEENADLFRQDKLVERCWQIWRQGYDWIITTTEQIAEARNQLLVQRSLEKWTKRVHVHRQLYQQIDHLSNRRVLTTFLRHWQTKTLESRQKKWRQDMRQKMKIVRHIHESSVIKEVWSRWRHMIQSRAAYQSYLNRLLVRAYVGWDNKMVKIKQFNAIAEDFQTSRNALAVTYWRKWRRVVEYRSAETTMRGRVNLRIIDDTFRKWNYRLQTYAVAENLFRRHLMARILNRWSRRVTEIQRLEKRAEKHLAKSDVLLLYAVMRIWKAHTNGNVLEREQSKRQKAFAWRRWKAKFESNRVDMLRAEKFSMRPTSSLVATAFGQWKKKIIEVKSREQLADALHMSHLAIVSMQQWRTCLRKKMETVKIARAASRYFQMRRAWFRWVEMIEAKRRERLVHLFTLNTKKRIFEAWLNRTRLERQRRLAVREVQNRIDWRILRVSLDRWTNRVIELRSREMDIEQHRNMVVLATAFQKFRTRYSKIVEAQNLLESFMYLEQKDLLRRTFYRWLTTARSSHDRRLALRDKENEIRVRTLEVAWDKWREKSLRSGEDEILLQRQRNILCRLFFKWNGKTKAPPAIRFDSTRVKNQFLNRWKRGLAQARKVKEASLIDRQRVAAKFFEKWLEAYRTKKTLKAIARARHLRLPAASSKNSTQRNLFPRRNDFVHPRVESDEDEDSDVGSLASAIQPARALSGTSSTYISGRAPSIVSSASRFSFPKPRERSPIRTLQVPTSVSGARRETRTPPLSFRKAPSSIVSEEPPQNPTRAFQVPTNISRARSDTRTSPPPSRKGASSVVSEEPPRRSWGGLQRKSRPFFSPPS